jgi:site-specific DNA-cytosine methylase
MYIPPLVVTKDFARKLTPLECIRCFGLPDDWCDIPGITDNQKYKAIGNSIALHPLQWLFERIDAIHEVILDIG